MKRAMRFLPVMVLFAACATPPPPKPSHLDPASAEAPEAPLPPKSTALVIEPVPEDAPKAPAPTVSGYSCPMHPEVQAAEPGRCPKCGMNLAPKEPPPAGGTGPHHHHGSSP